MANSMQQNPWIVDTAGATSVFSGKVKIGHLRWVGGTTAGHHCTVTNAAGTRVIWDSEADAANYSDETYFGIEGKFSDGIQVTVLGSGKLYIYIE